MTIEKTLAEHYSQNHSSEIEPLLNKIESDLMVQALERTGWNKNKASSLLKMNRTTLVEKLKKTPQTAGAWITFHGDGTAGIDADFNAGGFVDNGVGDYTITFDTAWADVFYTYAGSGEDTLSDGYVQIGRGVGATKTTTAIRLLTLDATDANKDFPEVTVVFFGNQ